MGKPDSGNDFDKSPPFFKTWKGWYIFVLAHLVFLIIFFFLFTKFFE